MLIVVQLCVCRLLSLTFPLYRYFVYIAYVLIAIVCKLISVDCRLVNQAPERVDPHPSKVRPEQGLKDVR